MSVSARNRRVLGHCEDSRHRWASRSGGVGRAGVSPGSYGVVGQGAGGGRRSRSCRVPASGTAEGVRRPRADQWGGVARRSGGPTDPVVRRLRRGSGGLDRGRRLRSRFQVLHLLNQGSWVDLRYKDRLCRCVGGGPCVSITFGSGVALSVLDPSGTRSRCGGLWDRQEVLLYPESRVVVSFGDGGSQGLGSVL